MAGLRPEQIGDLREGRRLCLLSLLRPPTQLLQDGLPLPRLLLPGRLLCSRLLALSFHPRLEHGIVQLLLRVPLLLVAAPPASAAAHAALAGTPVFDPVRADHDVARELDGPARPLVDHIHATLRLGPLRPGAAAAGLRALLRHRRADKDT